VNLLFPRARRPDMVPLACWVNSHPRGRAGQTQPFLMAGAPPKGVPVMRKEALVSSVIGAVVWLAAVPGRCGAG